MIGFYHARAAWGMLQQLQPDRMLVSFPTPRADKQYGMPLEEASGLLIEGFADYEARKNLRPSTKTNTQNDLKCLLGFLQKHQDFDVQSFCGRFDLAEDLYNILLAGFPPAVEKQAPSPADELRLLAEDEDYLDAILRTIRRDNQLHFYKKGYVRDNPFLVLYAEWHMQRGTAAMAERALKMFRALGEHYLRVEKSQRKWLNDLLARVVDSKTKQNPSEREVRKQLAATDDELWDKLVAALPRLAVHTEQRYEEWLAAEAEAPGSAKAARALRSWAVALRNELLMGMLLCFTLRKENLQGLRLESTAKLPKSIFPENYSILLPPQSTKAKEWIRRKFPDGGPFSHLRNLLDLYLAKARPVLLGECGETPYLFVSGSNADRSARDEEGHHRLSRERLPVTVRKICKDVFGDILPPGMDVFNVHLVRDMFTQHADNYEGGTGLAAQGLANTAGTIDQHYRRIDRQGDRKVRRHLESLPGGKASRGPKKGQFDAEVLRAKFRQQLGPNVDDRTIDGLVKTVFR